MPDQPGTDGHSRAQHDMFWPLYGQSQDPPSGQDLKNWHFALAVLQVCGTSKIMLKGKQACNKPSLPPQQALRKVPQAIHKASSGYTSRGPIVQAPKPSRVVNQVLTPMLEKAYVKTYCLSERPNALAKASSHYVPVYVSLSTTACEPKFELSQFRSVGCPADRQRACQARPGKAA